MSPLDMQERLEALLSDLRRHFPGCKSVSLDLTIPRRDFMALRRRYPQHHDEEFNTLNFRLGDEYTPILSLSLGRPLEPGELRRPRGLVRGKGTVRCQEQEVPYRYRLIKGGEYERLTAQRTGSIYHLTTIDEVPLLSERLKNRGYKSCLRVYEVPGELLSDFLDVYGDGLGEEFLSIEASPKQGQVVA